MGNVCVSMDGKVPNVTYQLANQTVTVMVNAQVMEDVIAAKVGLVCNVKQDKYNTVK